VEEGIVPGGGVTLVRASRALAKLNVERGSDEATGVRIVEAALSEPLKQLVRNAGGDGGVIIRDLEQRTEGKKKAALGYNVLTGEFVDLYAAGIIDPAKVTRAAVENAASIAAMILTTDVLISDLPEKEKPPMPEMPDY
jgi:chaperonin GroEL